MNLKSWRKFSLNKRLLFLVTGLLLVATLSVGIAGYMIAKRELDARGETILVNAVKQARMLIQAKHKAVDKGMVDTESAKEEIKRQLLGPMQSDGTRALHGDIDLGPNGYLILYDLEGTEIMHPTLEGQNVWEVSDPKDPDFHFVQEQITAAIDGGSFVRYHWAYPDSDRIGEKLTYAEYEPAWDWVVVATAYRTDFNRGADDILRLLFIVSVLLLIFGITAAILYVDRITDPIIRVSKGMRAVEEGYFYPVTVKASGDEVQQLVSGYNNMVRAITEAREDLEAHADRIAYLAYNDELTGLANRNKLSDHFNDSVRKHYSGSLVQFDLADFKVINAMIGYEKANELIAEVGQHLADHLSSEGLFARTGGNEFSLWIPNYNAKRLHDKLALVRETLNDAITLTGINHAIDFHTAIAHYPDHGLGFETLYNHATMAMKFAKDIGDLKPLTYHEDMATSIEKEVALREAVKEALEKGEIRPVYQAKTNAHTGEVVGVEALARWTSKDLGEVTPGRFIPAIDNANLTGTFGRYMLNRVLAQHDRILERFGCDTTIAVNISPLFFLESGFTETITEALKRHGVPANHLMLEITEDIFIADIEAVERTISKLRALGVGISLDDFGTGYSSLNYLRYMTIDELKIDRSFIRQATTDEAVYDLLTFLVQLADSHGYHLVAEGVETRKEKERITAAGFTIVQGYYYHRPEDLL